MYVIDSETRDGFWTGGETNRFLKVLLSPFIQPEVDNITIGMVIVPPATNSDYHTHETAQEIWYVIEGQCQYRIGDEISDVKAGDIVYGPAKVPHQIINNSIDKCLKALYIMTPNGEEKATIEKIRQACAREEDK